MITVYKMHPLVTAYHIGMIPEFLDERDPRPAKEQLHTNYAHGGGWHPMHGFERDARTNILRYPGDPPFVPLARMQLRDETIIVYEHAIVCIIQKDGTFEAARMD